MYRVVKLSHKKMGKISVWFSEEQQFILSQSCFLAFPLKKNQNLSQKEFQSFVDNYHYFLCKEKALLHLSYREHSEQELKIKLLSKKFPKKTIETVLHELKENDYLNEKRLIQLIIDNFLNSNKLTSILEIKNKLYKKGINETNLNKVSSHLFQEMRDKEENLLLSYYAKEFKGGSEVSFKRKIFPKLLRKGFSYEILIASFSRFWENI